MLFYEFISFGLYLLEFRNHAGLMGEQGIGGHSAIFGMGFKPLAGCFVDDEIGFMLSAESVFSPGFEIFCIQLFPGKVLAGIMDLLIQSLYGILRGFQG